MQKSEPAEEELQIGLSQQQPITLSPPSRRYRRPSLSRPLNPSMANMEHAEDCSPSVYQSESSGRVTRQCPQTRVAHDSRFAQSPNHDDEAERADNEQMKGEEAEEMAEDIPSQPENESQALHSAQALQFPPEYGSQLALSLGELDMPQLMPDRDLRQGQMGLSPRIKSKPCAFGHVLSNNLMLNNMENGGSSPKSMAAGDPVTIAMLQNLEHWSEKARQEQQELAQQAQQPGGRQLLPMHQPYSASDLKSCSPCSSPRGSAAFMLPPGCFQVPEAVPGHGSRITSGAGLNADSFQLSRGSTVPGGSSLPFKVPFGSPSSPYATACGTPVVPCLVPLGHPAYLSCRCGLCLVSSA